MQNVSEIPYSIGIIPARGDSKGVNRKNIRQLGGKPLIAWTVKTSLSCSSLQRIIVSTDDLEIANIAKEYGAEVPFLRPPELAKDDTPDFPVYQHTISWLVEHENFQPDIVAWLRPTSPLRTAEDITNAVDVLTKTQADSVRSVCLSEHHPYWMKSLEGDRLVPFIDGFDEKKYFRRQLLPPVYRLNGAVDVTWCKKVMETEQLFFGDIRGYFMPSERSIDLDTELDFAVAEVLLQRRKL